MAIVGAGAVGGTRNFVLAVCSLASSVGCGTTCAQDTYPAKPIRIITAAAGGSSDFASRIVAQGLTASLGQQVIVENRGGGSGIIAAQTLAKAPVDGYTLLIFSSPIWMLPLLQNNVPYDPVRDLAPISAIDRSPSVLVVHPSLPVRSVRDLVNLAKAKPGQLNYSRASAGGPSHLGAELLKRMAQIDMVAVPYKGGGPATLALVGGEVELTFASAAAVSGPLKARRVRALAVTTLEPSALFPDLPTMAASGLPGYECVLVNGMFAATGTAPTLIARLNDEVVRYLHRREVKERFLATHTESLGSSPRELDALVKSDIAKWGKLIKEANIRGD